MRRRLVMRWLLAGVFGVSFLPGCCDVSTRRALAPSTTMPVALAQGPQSVATSYNSVSRPTAVSEAPAVVEAPTSQAIPVTAASSPVPSEVSGEELPALQATASAVGTGPATAEPPAIAATVAAPAPAPAATAVVSDIVQTGDVTPVVDVAEAPAPAPSLSLEPVAEAEPQPTFPRAEPAPPRRSFVDLSASPCFGHAPDYSWITGQVEHSRTAHEWRLRYASVDETDRFGGRVALIENQHVSYLVDGQYVRVRGHLADTGSANTSAHYRIESFEVIQDPNAAAPTAAK
jgi:hypothetical protein